MGPWAALAEDWFGISVPITGIKSTSIVFKSKSAAEAVEPFALFCGEDDRFGTHLEVYPRSSGEVYLCGSESFVPSLHVAMRALSPHRMPLRHSPSFPLSPLYRLFFLRSLLIGSVGGSEYVTPERLRAGEFPPGEVHPDPHRVEAATKSFSLMSKKLGGSPDTTQACMRPCPPDAMPLMVSPSHPLTQRLSQPATLVHYAGVLPIICC
jgi:glycine/D-amino acid oxidase-like deaminating enzyme